MSRCGLLAVVVAGCAFEAPAYDGTTYACSAEAPACPPGFECIDDVCVRPGTLGAEVATFGERADADHQDVSFDVTLRSDDPLVNVGDLPGLEIDAAPPKATLMQFDVSALPPGVQVVSATLEVEVFDPIETGSFQLYPVTEAWDEDAATWIERTAAELWTTQGAGEGASDLARLVADVAADAVGRTEVELNVDVVQAWIASPSDNHGFVWTSGSPDGRGGQLRSTEADAEDERPLLRIEYQRP